MSPAAGAWRVRLCRLAVSVAALAASVQCVTPLCDLPRLWHGCKKSQGSEHDLFDGGYNFGWQPYQQLRDMCRSKRHVKLLLCLHNQLTSQCQERKDYIALLTIFNHNMYETAAEYICEDHNIGIFEQSVQCLQQFHSEARTCAQARSIMATIATAEVKISRAINNTNERTQVIRTDKEALLRFIRSTVEEELCADRKVFIGCLERQFLRDKQLCIDPMVMLLIKYYSYLMPEWCRHSVVARGFSHQPMADQQPPRSRDTAADLQHQQVAKSSSFSVGEMDERGSAVCLGACVATSILLAIAAAASRTVVDILLA